MFIVIIEKFFSTFKIPDIVLLILSIVSLFILILSFHKTPHAYSYWRKILGLFVLLFTTTFIYFVIDKYVSRLPDPIIPYILYILLFTIFLGVRIGVLLSIITIFLIEYYLYEPRYIFGITHHPLNIVFISFGLMSGVAIGHEIRKHQQKIEKHSQDLDLLVKAKDQFTAIAVHELKTPLTAISLYSQMLDKQNKNETASKTVQKSIQTITRETGKLTYMINDLLDFSRFQRNKFQLNAEVFNLADLCKERIAIAKTLFPHHIFILRQYVKNTAIYGDRIAIDRVITNLLTNAGKYSFPKSTIIVTLYKRYNSFIICVKDKGVGIDKNHLDKIFEPFYQVESGKKGLGLGLHIAKSIIELHNGKIWAESKIDKGTAFYIRLPVNFQKS